jgi:hypothetical protein
MEIRVALYVMNAPFISRIKSLIASFGGTDTNM